MTTPAVAVDTQEQFQVRVVMSPDAVLLAPLEIVGRSRLAIEVFRSLAELPPELAGPDARCGVAAIWTRRGTGV